MRTIIGTLSVLVSLALPLRASAQHHSGVDRAPDPGGQQATSARFEDLQWQAIVPDLGADSPHVAILRVDPKTQATQLLIRIPAAMHVPMHWHSANETHTVIKGRFVFEHDGQRHELGPGGFNYLPARVHHQAWASDDALVFITVDSGWDVNWVAGPPTRQISDNAHPVTEWPAGRTPNHLTMFGTAVSVAVVPETADSRPVTSSDGELARAIASAPPGTAHDEESELYRRFAHRVRLYGLKHLRDRAAAEDLAHEVLLLTIERLRAGEVRNPDEIGSFILGTSRMLAGSTERKARRREKLTAAFPAAELYADPDVMSGEVVIMERCLHLLSERDRRVLVLTFYVDKASSEIAEELGVTPTVVRVARHRALERLRDCVGV